MPRGVWSSSQAAGFSPRGLTIVEGKLHNMSDIFDPSQFFSQPENVALNVPADELFDTFSRSLKLPPQWAALVTHADGNHLVVGSGDVVSHVDTGSVLFVRTSPFEVSLIEDGLASSDYFSFSVRISILLGVLTDKSELTSLLHGVVGSRRVVQIKHLADYVRPSVRVALEGLIASHNASAIVGTGVREEADATVADALKGPCFTAGLSLRARPSTQFESKTYSDAVRVRAMAAVRTAEHDAARRIDQALTRARTEKIGKLAEDISRLKKLAADSPDVELPQLLQSFSQQQRGALYEALLACHAPSLVTRWIVVASGDEVLFFERSSPDRLARRVAISGGAGPLRSVHVRRDQSGESVLWLGAATGVYRLPLGADHPDLTLQVDDAPKVRGGFNSVAVTGNRLFATHSELGLYEWNISMPDAGKRRFEKRTQTAKAIRCAIACGDDVYFSIDDHVFRFAITRTGDEHIDAYRGSDSTITAIHIDKTLLYAGNASGDVLSWPMGAGDAPERLHRGMNRAVESVWIVTTGGVRQLVYTDTSTKVYARVLGDSFGCYYQAGGQTLRRVEVAEDVLVATNDIRDRLIVWTAGEPKKPQAVVPIASLTGRSVQDVCLV